MIYICSDHIKSILPSGQIEYFAHATNELQECIDIFCYQTPDDAKRIKNLDETVFEHMKYFAESVLFETIMRVMDEQNIDRSNRYIIVPPVNYHNNYS